MQAPREEGWLVCGMIVGQPATKFGHDRMWEFGGEILTGVSRPIANRPQVDNLPHTAPQSLEGWSAQFVDGTKHNGDSGPELCRQILSHLEAV